MKLLHQKIGAIFVIILIVSITPAFASKMEEISKEAQKYDEDSKKSMGFFAKVKFMVKGFQLSNKAKNAQKEADLIDKEENNDNNDKKKFELMTYQTVNSIITKNKLINFRNREYDQSNTNSVITSVNGTMKGINTTNEVSVTHTQSSEDFIIPEACQISADHIMQLLRSYNLMVSQIIQKEIDIGLTGHIVQLIDKNGFIRYAYVKNIVLTGENPYVIIQSHENGEKMLSLYEFKKSYSGIVFNLDNSDSPEIVLDTIVILQKEELDNQKNAIESQKDKTRNKIIVNVLLIGLGVILAIIGAFIATYFGKQLVSRFNEIKKVRVFNFVNDVGEPVGDYKIKSDISGGSIEINKINAERAVANAESEIPNIYEPIKSEEDYSYYIAHRMVYFLRDKLMPEFGAYVAQRTAEGCLIVGASTLEMLGYIVSENWVKVILCVVGLIIFLAGLALTIYAGYKTIEYVLLFLEYKGMLESKKKNINTWNTWLTSQWTNTTYTDLNTSIGTNNNLTAV